MAAHHAACRGGNAVTSQIDDRRPKTLLPGKPVTEPSWFVWCVMKTTRVLAFTVLWTGLGMGVGLFCGIVGVILASAFAHHAPVMSMAYRRVAFPVAITSGTCAFLWNVFRAIQAGKQRMKHGRKRG
jgi:hypothetical protein